MFLVTISSGNTIIKEITFFFSWSKNEIAYAWGLCVAVTHIVL